jgi:predicted RNA-binding Zn-ribbon protein involved in translation (DUF1610 family)
MFRAGALVDRALRFPANSGGGLGKSAKPLTKLPLYSVVVAQKPGVLCKSCGKGIEIDDEYVPGIRGAVLAASLYQVARPVEGSILSSAIRPWQKTLSCANPDCGKTHTCRTDDLCLYDS